jgi:hypothetical protein
MDERLRSLERQAYARGDMVLLDRLYHSLASAQAPLDHFIKLRRFIATLIPEGILGEEVEDDIAKLPTVELFRVVSRYLYRNGYDIYEEQMKNICRCGHLKHKAQCPASDGCWCDTYIPDYDNPPEGHSTWAFIELDETRYWSEEVQNNVVAITGVYLVDTGTNWHLAYAQKSVWLGPQYANVFDVVRSDETDAYGEEWLGNDGHYIARHDLRYAVGWHWVTLEDLADSADHIDDIDDPDAHQYIGEALTSYYAGDPPL